MSTIQNNVDHIRHDRNIDLKSWNGPEWSVSAASVDSLHLIGFGLRQLKNDTEKLYYYYYYLFIYRWQKCFT